MTEASNFLHSFCEKHEIKPTYSNTNATNGNFHSPQAKLKALLEKRKTSTSQSKRHVKLHDADLISGKDMTNVLEESDILAKHLQEQVSFYQEALAGLRQRTEDIVSENEGLYKRLKETSTVSNFAAHFDENDERRYRFQLENELDEVKKLNQEKTNRLETIVISTRKEVEIYRKQVKKLQAQLRGSDFTLESENKENICAKCGGPSYFSSPPSMAELATIDKLTSEKNELADILTKHKSLLADCQRREFEAYMKVKESAEISEKAKLEKAEAIIKIKQLESSFDEERKRHETVVVSTNEKWKQEYEDTKEKHEKEKQILLAKIQALTQTCDENEHQLHKLTSEKVNLVSEVEKLKAELAASHIDIDKIKQNGKEEVLALTRQNVETREELDCLKSSQARQFKEHKQAEMSLTTENENLRRRLAEAQNGWVEAREENLNTGERIKQLENELHLLNSSKTNLEKAHEENREFFKRQDEQRERQFMETLQKTEHTNAELRQELEEMLVAQMAMSSAIKDENRKLISKLEEKKGTHRSEKAKWRQELGQLMNELETTRGKNREITSERETLCRTNEELAGKNEFLKRENKKSLKMVYNLLKKQKDLMQDRQNLSHKLESLQRSQIADSFLHPGYRAPLVAGNISTHENESFEGTSCNMQRTNVEIEKQDESL